MNGPFRSVEFYNLPIAFQRFEFFRSQLYRDFRFTSDAFGHVARLQGFQCRLDQQKFHPIMNANHAA